jgi:hypothetical protein
MKLGLGLPQLGDEATPQRIVASGGARGGLAVSQYYANVFAPLETAMRSGEV